MTDTDIVQLVFDFANVGLIGGIVIGFVARVLRPRSQAK